MAIITTFAAFRDRFATHVTGAYSVTFNITSKFDDAGANFVADGYVAGQRIQVLGSASNDGYYTIDTVAATRITILETIVSEGPVAVTLNAVAIDNDGFPSWPVELVRAAGFDGGITGFGATFTGAVWMTANAQAVDAVFMTDEYDWYVSQRTDVVSAQVLTAAPIIGPIASWSGSVTIAASPLADSLYGTTYTNTTVVAKLFNDCHVYCKRLSDGAIQWLDLYEHYMTV